MASPPQDAWDGVMDISDDGFRGFGRPRPADDDPSSPASPGSAGSPGRGSALPPASLPEVIHGDYDVRTTWNGEVRMTIDARGIAYKDSRVVPEEIVYDRAPDPHAPRAVRHRLRFTVFCPNQTSEWVRGVTGMIESFDVEFFVDEGAARAFSFFGRFRRRGEGCLDTEGGRATVTAADDADASGFGVLRRTKSKDPETSCPVCYREWEEEGVTQTQAKCGHAFCLTCVVSVCNMTPPRELGTCPMCRADVALGDLVRVERTGKARNEEEEN